MQTIQRMSISYLAHSNTWAVILLKACFAWCCTETRLIPWGTSISFSALLSLILQYFSHFGWTIFTFRTKSFKIFKPIACSILTLIHEAFLVLPAHLSDDDFIQVTFSLFGGAAVCVLGQCSSVGVCCTWSEVYTDWFDEKFSLLQPMAMSAVWLFVTHLYS